jgi:multidrug resistance efflux pump
MELKGKIAASQIANIKFAISGKLLSLSCKIGDKVRKGQLLATLNKTELQAYLDRSLKQYDLERALFDEKQKQNLTEYEKRKVQGSLDISVKDVEIAKSNLEGTDLYSSINGVVTNIDSANPGDNITPAGFVINIIDQESFYFLAELPEENLSQITIGQQAKVTLKAYPDKILEGKVEQISFIPIKEGLFPITISISPDSFLRLGLTGTATLD